MEERYRSLILSGKKYSSEALSLMSGNIMHSESSPGWQKKIYLFIQEWLSVSTTITVNTSGTTGNPKTISFSKNNMIKSALRTGAFLKLKPADKVLLCLPVDFIAGKMMIIRSFVLGLDLYPVYPSSNPVFEVNQTFDFAAMTPMQVYSILNGFDGVKKLNNISTLIIGGGEMDTVLAKMLSNLSNKTFHTYGMTETLTHIAMKRLTGPNPESSYHAVPGVLLEQDGRNCLMINDNLLGLEKMVTNDLVKLISKSTFDYLGRFDHIINTGGIKVHPEIIENKLKPYIPNRIVIVGKKDKMLGEKVVLIVETGKFQKPDDMELTFRNAALGKYEQPKEIFYVDFFPESSSGKILRNKLLGMV